MLKYIHRNKVSDLKRRKGKKMNRTQKDTLINEVVNNGMTYLGLVDIRGLEVVNEYKALSKEVAKRFPGMVLCWDPSDTGCIWIS